MFFSTRWIKSQRTGTHHDSISICEGCHTRVYWLTACTFTNREHIRWYNPPFPLSQRKLSVERCFCWAIRQLCPFIKRCGAFIHSLKQIDRASPQKLFVRSFLFVSTRFSLRDGAGGKKSVSNHWPGWKFMLEELEKTIKHNSSAAEWWDALPPKFGDQPWEIISWKFNLEAKCVSISFYAACLISACWGDAML